MKAQWLLLAIFTTLPYVVPGAAGAWWLYESGWALWWVAWAALVSLAGWPLAAWLKKRSATLVPTPAGPGYNSPSCPASDGLARNKGIFAVK